MTDLGVFLFGFPGLVGILVLLVAPMLYAYQQRQRGIRESDKLAQELARQQARKRKKRTRLRVPQGAGKTAVLLRAFGEQLEPAPSRLQPQRRSEERALLLLDVWSTLLPARVNSEDLGDYIEKVNERIQKGEVWRAYSQTAGAIVWTTVNSIGYFLKEVGWRKTV